MQLLGYYLVQYARDRRRINKDILILAESAAVRDLEANVFEPTLAPLSNSDRLFLQAMAECGTPVTTTSLKEKLGQDGPALQPYRKRLLETGIIESPRRGELVFSIPYFDEYLRKTRDRYLAP